MDMIIKAAVLAAEGVDHMAREGLDHTQTQIEALSRAVGVANELGCEDEDVSSAFARLIKTQELVETRRAQLHKNALSSIADQADNGLGTTGMAPCTTAAQLKSDIAAAVDALVARVREGGVKLSAVFGHAEPVFIDPENLVLKDRTLYIGDREFSLASIVAVSTQDRLAVVGQMGMGLISVHAVAVPLF